jgi:hypothetical protein
MHKNAYLLTTYSHHEYSRYKAYMPFNNTPSTLIAITFYKRSIFFKIRACQLIDLVLFSVISSCSRSGKFSSCKEHPEIFARSLKKCQTRVT